MCGLQRENKEENQTGRLDDNEERKDKQKPASGHVHTCTDIL